MGRIRRRLDSAIRPLAPLRVGTSRIGSAAAKRGNRIFATGAVPPGVSSGCPGSLTGAFLGPGWLTIDLHIPETDGG